MDPRLLDILVCPLCKGRLFPNDDRTELVCRADRLAYPVQDGVPVMLETLARILPIDGNSDSHDLAGLGASLAANTLPPTA